MKAKTLLLTSIAPGKHGVGEAFLREICLQLPKQDICCFVARSSVSGLATDSNDLDWMPVESRSLPPEHALDLLKSAPSEFQHFKSRILRAKAWSAHKELIEQIVSFGRRQSASRIFAVLSDPLIILNAEQIARELRVPITCLVWDPPETTMVYMGYDKHSRKIVMERFRSLLKLCDRLAVASTNMAEYYKTAYAVSGVPLIKPLDESNIHPVRKANKDDLIIGFSGSVYATEELNALIRTLASVSWQVAGRPVTLRMMTNTFDVPLNFSGQSARIELLGFKNLKETILTLATCDFAYLPYWLTPNFSLSSRVCFPDKLGTYVSAGVPVLFHGPEFSMPAEMVRKYDLGVSCHSNLTEDILQSIQMLSLDTSLRERLERGRARILREVYNRELFQEKVAMLVGTTSAELQKQVQQPAEPAPV